MLGGGIAQGSVVSPFFSNIYLHSLDEFAVDKKYRYVRYSDNFIMFSRGKEEIYKAFEDIQGFLKDELKLKLNENAYPFKDVDKGFVFLGIYFKGNLRTISMSKEKKIIRKLNWLTDAFHQKDPRKFLGHLNESVKGSRRYYGVFKPLEQFKAFDQHLLKRLKFLLVHFLRKGMLTSRDEVRPFLLKVEFYYTERTESDRNALCKSLEAGIFAVLDAGKKVEKKPAIPEKEQAAQARRQTAQKSRFLRMVANQAEVVVSSPGIFIGKTGERLIIREQRKNLLELHFSKVRNVSVNSIGVSLSSDVIFQCSQKKIPITFYTYKGTPYAILQAPVHSMASVSVLQIRTYETDKALELVKRMISGKARSQMNLVKFYLRARKKVDPEFAEKAGKNLEIMDKTLRELQRIQFENPYSVARDKIFSAEARISARYWACMRMVVPSDLGFERRDRHNARDLVNNMLNYGYGILYQRVWQAVLKAGLNPHISFLQAFQANKPTLVYDMVEEFRQPFADRAVFSLLTRGKRGADLKLDKKTGLLVKDSRNKVTKAVLNRLGGLVKFSGEKVRGEDIIHVQANNLVSFLEGKSIYKPFIGRY